MAIMIAGLALFFGAHLVTTQRELRMSLIERFGAGSFKGLYSVVAVVGLALIIVGFGRYRAAGYIDVWAPPRFTRHIAMSLMPFAFVALAAAYAPRGKIAGWLRHPFLAAIKIWAAAHLIANGDLGSILLFGSFLAYAVFDRICVKRRGDAGAPRAAAFNSGDAIALAVGVGAYAAMLFAHKYLIGVAIIGA